MNNFLARAIRKRLTRKLDRRINGALCAKATEGRSPVDMLAAAVEAECGFHRAAGETLMEYAARAAGVSTDCLERFYQAREAGETANAGEFAPVVAFMERIGRRLQ